MKKNILSVEQLIKGKVELKQSDDTVIEKTLYIPRLNADIKISLTKADVRDFLEVTQDPKSTNEQSIGAGRNLIYSIVSEPNLKDKELQKAFECEEPTDIVPAIFTDGEMIDIAEYAIEVGGFRKGTISVVEELKN